MGNEFVMVPRELAERIATSIGYEERDELREILAKPAEQGQGEPLGWVRPEAMEAFRDVGWVHVFAAKGGDDSAVAVYTHADPGEVERLREGMKYESERAELCLEELQECESQRDEFYAEITGLRAQLAGRDALLARTLPYLSNTPDLVQHGAEDLAEEIRSASAGRPCYGPNEWGTECGKCSKCKHSSAEPSAPIERSGLKECPKGYGHGGQWCGPSYNCWLDRRSDEEKARAAMAHKPLPIHFTHQVGILKLGIQGAAYDQAGTYRAYTYEEQPHNVEASKLGRAASAAKPGGDWIDYGLSLLKALQDQGFGVFDLNALERKP